MLYSFFQAGKYGNIEVPYGGELAYPDDFFPMKYVQQGAFPNSSIFIVASGNKILYYAMYLVDPYHLAVSGGYSSIAPLVDMDIKGYLRDGYMLQLVY